MPPIGREPTETAWAQGVRAEAALDGGASVRSEAELRSAWRASDGKDASLPPVALRDGGEETGAPSAPVTGGGPDAIGEGSSPGLALAAPVPDREGPAPEYVLYLARLRQRIQETLHYPFAARRRELAGTVQLEILVLPTGAIGSASLLRSSSHRILDEAALDAVRSLAPIPFPDGLMPRTLRVRLPVVFELR